MSNSTFEFQPLCIVCSTPAATIKITIKNGRPFLRYQGPGGNNIRNNNDPGDPISIDRAEAIQAAFTTPYDPSKIRTADFYDDAGYCLSCQSFYCSDHWAITSTGGGTCPRGHFKSLDPHWSPE